MEIITEFEQGEDAWFKARIGSIGGSSIQAAVAKGQGKTRKTLMYRMAGELLSGEKYEGYVSQEMLNGMLLEPAARRSYKFIKDVGVKQVAMIRETEHTHVSPDGLVDDDDGMIEIKCVIPSTHVETIDKNVIPASYRKQIQWGLNIAQRNYCDFVSYSPLIKQNDTHIIRCNRDEKLIKELDEGAEKFIEEMIDLYNRVQD